MKSEQWIEGELADLRGIHQYRSLTSLPAAGGKIQWQDRTFINFSSNDYLDFLCRDELKSAAIEAISQYGTGSGASRLVTGTLPIHDELEQALARHKGYPSALLFGSGFLANLGVVSSLVGRNDVILADRLTHASLIDAIRLSGAELIRYHHNDMEDLTSRLKNLQGHKGKKLIITESVFSMDGDVAPLPELVFLAQEHHAMLMVDEAHATGIFGPTGCGLVASQHLQEGVTIVMSTLSKALGGYGGSIACSPLMREWLINKARSFIYTTAPPPGICGAGLAALKLLEDEPDLGNTLLERARGFRQLLHEYGFDTGASTSQIVPVIVGENEAAMRLAGQLQQHGILVAAIRPPTVPQGTARLRFSITLAHREEDLTHAARILQMCAHEEGLLK